MKALLVSNGHGEDTIGTALAGALEAKGCKVSAVPLVGSGEAYLNAGVEALGPRRALPSGGYPLTGGGALLADLRAGLIGSSFAAWRTVLRSAKDADALIAIGDWYALAVASLARGRPLFGVQPAMSVRAWPDDAPAWKAPFGPLERRLMRRCLAIYPRDSESAAWLRVRGAHNVHDLGNPMLDAISGDAPVAAPPPYLALLPGTREDANFSLPIMLEACRSLRDAELTPVIAWSRPGVAAAPEGWELQPTGSDSGVTHSFVHADGTTVALARGAFATIVAGAKGAISTSGTAAEQCAGRGIPIVAFVTGGPQYTEVFARAQRRALGRALTVTAATPAGIADELRAVVSDGERLAAVRRDGRAAMGDPGSAERIASDILDRLGTNPAPDRSTEGETP